MRPFKFFIKRPKFTMATLAFLLALIGITVTALWVYPHLRSSNPGVTWKEALFFVTIAVLYVIVTFLGLLGILVACVNEEYDPADES